MVSFVIWIWVMMIIALPGKFTGTGRPKQRVVRHAYNELDSVVLTPVLDPISINPNLTPLYYTHQMQVEVPGTMAHFTIVRSSREWVKSGSAGCGRGVTIYCSGPPERCCSECKAVHSTAQALWRTVESRKLGLWWRSSPPNDFRAFLQYFHTVGWVFWPVKTVSHITYTVLEGT